MKYLVEITMEVDDEAPWLEVGETNNCEIIQETLKDLLYDLNDIILEDISVELTK